VVTINQYSVFIKYVNDDSKFSFFWTIVNSNYSTDLNKFSKCLNYLKTLPFMVLLYIIINILFIILIINIHKFFARDVTKFYIRISFFFNKLSFSQLVSSVYLLIYYNKLIFGFRIIISTFRSFSLCVWRLFGLAWLSWLLMFLNCDKVIEYTV
jgi:hypothetical protein